LIELAVVLVLLAILVSLGTLALQGVLAAARVNGTVADVTRIRAALLRLHADCEGLAAARLLTDPGLVTRPSWASACWKGPYLGRWPAVAPLGGSYEYLAPERTGGPQNVTLSVRGLGEDEARRLAAAIVAQLGTGSLAQVTYQAGDGGGAGTWRVGLIVGSNEVLVR
jgi:hypothetical protein